MPNETKRGRDIRVFRYDPAKGGEGRFDRYALEIADEARTTILDVLIRLQREQDPTLSFRYACRVNMCGSCGMVINGREGLACKTNVSDLPAGREITLRPLNHFPVVKDLVVDMEPFFRSYESCLPFFHPKEDALEPAVIRPDSRERRAIGLATECIACGCCVSSCTMAAHHPDYAGPAPLNRAFTLLVDSRDGLYRQRMDRVGASCTYCRTEFNCTEACPKEISPTRAIKHIQRLALRDVFSGAARAPAADAPPAPAATPAPAEPGATRRRFLAALTAGAGAAVAAGLGGLFSAALAEPSLRSRPSRWVPAGPADRFRPGEVAAVALAFEETDGFYRQARTAPVLVRGGKDLAVYSASCTHLGCTVRWDAGQRLFLCACHGGAFHPDGSVKAGPPPRPLDRLPFRVENGILMVRVT